MVYDKGVTTHQSSLTGCRLSCRLLLCCDQRTL